MYIITILTLIIFLAYNLSISSSPVGLATIIDPPSLVMILLIVLPILFATGLFKDFIKSFTIVATKKEVPLLQLKRSLEAVSIAIKASIYTGVLGFMFGIIIGLKTLDDLSALGPNLIAALCPLLYACMIAIVLMAIKYKLKVMILEFTK